MENDAATLYCPNELCQAPNPLTHKFCQRCSTPLPKRFLWAVADGQSVANAGELLADRYLVINKALVLDTKPGLLPQTPDGEHLQAIRPYLRLFPFRLHVPQVYGVLPVSDGTSNKEILLLEKPPLSVLDSTDPLQVQVACEFTTAWRNATSMRQLNLLWQIAHLWQPLTSEGVASSLLNPEFVRVEGSLVRLLELRHDNQTSPNLPQLGEFWQQLQPQANGAIAEFLREICRCLIAGEIHSGEQLVAIIDRGLAELGRTQTPIIKIATKSDTGPCRQRNEDACYPPSGSVISKPPQPTAIAIVCDGIGGHEGGNVASNLAIETIQKQLYDLTKLPSDRIDSAFVVANLETAAAAANDIISQRNDDEHRQGRQRMGTTLVMALPIVHEMYITHVGDSRAYWMTRSGCYQVTLDDDVASREVRLGYATYRDAMQQGASGSLVQALGMSASNSLHPTSQRFLLDEDCVFLLCSDGLSDFDRVEQYWETEILPIITENFDIAKVTDKLVEIANTQNGHDNVTIAIVHCQVKYSEPKSTLKAALADLSTLPKASHTQIRTRQGSLGFSQNQKTHVISTSKSPKGVKLPLQLIVIPLLFVVVSLLLGYLWHQGLLPIKKLTNSSPRIIPSEGIPLVAPPIKSGSQDGSDKSAANAAQVIQTTSEIEFIKTTSPPTGVIAPKGSVLQILSRSEKIEKDSWIYLRVCSIGQASPSNSQSTSSTANKPVVSLGDEVKILSSKFKSLKVPKAKPEVVSQCQPSKQTSISSPAVKESAPESKPKSVPPQ
ncbi:protein phosphatase 2C domain-containing protein [Brasilonema sp. UFV-L1]|uniref:protein phosphatase 2C domain-containing protein n=1 Tax=Brasilonema sp. UFV-L1 TaxID=2234130 RepID=UPI00145F908C|nr:protein phosphatase 2C domain-containing protein [Brasilonema sp. UFV-L1]NMG10228.1 serine/threonine protein phosphatase [Brasilonema sp. UFV-L1]